MKEMFAYCGLPCHTCPILLATHEPDPSLKHEMRVKIARQIEQRYGTEIHADQVTDCDGCLTAGGRLFGGCRECQIRPCAREKGIENCAFCEPYPCEKLRVVFAKEPEAKKYLDAIRTKNG